MLACNIDVQVTLYTCNHTGNRLRYVDASWPANFTTGDMRTMMEEKAPRAAQTRNASTQSTGEKSTFKSSKFKIIKWTPLGARKAVLARQHTRPSTTYFSTHSILYALQPIHVASMAASGNTPAPAPDQTSDEATDFDIHMYGEVDKDADCLDDLAASVKAFMRKNR